MKPCQTLLTQLLLEQNAMGKVWQIFWRGQYLQSCYSLPASVMVSHYLVWLCLSSCLSKSQAQDSKSRQTNKQTSRRRRRKKCNVLKNRLLWWQIFPRMRRQWGKVLWIFPRLHLSFFCFGFRRRSARTTLSGRDRFTVAQRCKPAASVFYVNLCVSVHIRHS